MIYDEMYRALCIKELESVEIYIYSTMASVMKSTLKVLTRFYLNIFLLLKGAIQLVYLICVSISLTMMQSSIFLQYTAVALNLFTE